MIFKHAVSYSVFGAFWLLIAPAVHGQGTYQEPRAFLREAFPDGVPEPEALWIIGEIEEDVKALMEHDLGQLRVTYWYKGGRSAWILEEVGKELPITTGIVVNEGKIERIKVLIFRESRGWEVKYDFFTDQFKGAQLQDDNELDRPIDNISGATLSVRALTKLARLALFLHNHVSP